MMMSRSRRIGFGLLVSTALTAAFAAPGNAQERVPAVTIATTTEAYDPIRYEAAFIVAEAWRELGLEVNVQPTEFSTLLGRFYDQQDFDATIIGWSGRVDRLDPQFFLGTLDSRQSEPGGNNPGGYHNPEYDELFTRQSQEFDVEARQELVQQMQELYVPDAPVIVLFYRDEVVAYNNAAFEGMEAMAGEGLYSEWGPMQARPLTDRQTLRIGGPQEPDNLNPLASTSVWGWKWMRLYYDRLIRLSPDVEPINWMAASVEAVDDTTIDVTLREGLTFHDGEPVTAEDVAFTFNYYKSQSYAYFDAYLDSLENVEATGDLTVRFNLSEPSASFANIALSQISILPEHLWADIENPGELTPDQIPNIGSGPFKYDAYSRGEIMSLAKNEDHFHADEIAVDGVEFVIYADMEGVFTGLQTGAIDMTAWRMEAGQIPLAEQQDDLTVVTVPDFGYYHMTFNTKREPFDDREVRRALTQAMDRERMVNVLLDGRGEVGHSIIAPVNAFWSAPFVEQFEYDMDAARAALEEAGYSWDGEGRLVK
ncbi:ABC transporter substrate-binding protein [Aliihoeflea aestuarii]|jgi:peptide/nickel transport system substrate-binding protein|nr:ABC transporter substrate-binding protein [Aliihoeflea aestuarii]